MGIGKHFEKLDDAKAEAAAQSQNQRLAWVVDHVEDYQPEDYLVITGDKPDDAPGDFMTMFANGVEQASDASQQR